MFHLEILSFLKKKYPNEISLNPIDFPESPFHYIFLPERKTIIHCIDFKQNFNSHFLNLTQYFSEKNTKIIHLWEDVWLSKQEIIQSRLLSIIGKTQTIPARLCKIERIDKPTLDQFLNENHLQGTTNAKLKYGLFFKKSLEFRVLSSEFRMESRVIKNRSDGRSELRTQNSELLVAVASFSNAKTIIREGNTFRSYEMIRFANLKGFTVVGGLDKLLKNFIRENNPDDIMTYADRDWSDGKSYEKLGFELLEETPPQLFYLDNQQLTRHYPNKITDEEKTIMHEIWNTGNLKYLLNLKKNV